MRRLWSAFSQILGFFILLFTVGCLTVNVVYATETGGVSGDGSTEGDESDVKSGLTEENGKIVYYNEDGTCFTSGYKEIVVNGIVKYYYFQEDGSAFTEGYKAFVKDGKRVYYYFQKDGSAFTGGYLPFVQNGKQYYFYFQEDGTAFTDGYKEIIIDGTLRYFYFLANGQGYNTGYKTVMIDGIKYYFYFGSDGQAVTDKMEAVTFGTRTAYFLFQNNGTAYTGGYKEIAANGRTDYYYFLQNGQAYNTGYKTVVIDGVTYYFYFENDGKAFTDGLKQISFGSQVYYYFFQNSGKALTSCWNTVNGTKYYIQGNGRASKGWFCVGDGYYYADSNSAVLTNTVVQGYVLDATGKSTTKYRIVQIVNSLTNSSMSDQQKIEVLYNWILNNDMTYISNYEHISSSWVWKDSWVDDMAVSMMDNNGGNCYRYAAFFGMLIHEATGLPVIVYHGTLLATYARPTMHGWITVYQDGAWRSYDVQLRKFNRYPNSQCYGGDGALYIDGVGTNLY